MKLYEELEQLCNFKNQCLADAKYLEKQKQYELEIAREQIIKKYSLLSEIKFQEIREYDSRIDCYCKLLAAYSYFNANDIGNIIAGLIRIFEGKNYIYQDTFYDKGEVNRFVFDTDETNIRRGLKIVIAEECKADFYSESNFDLLIKDGKAIVLSTSDTFYGRIPFYRADIVNHSLEQCINFGKFSYIKEFIDELILYKIDKKIKYISPLDLENIEIDFICSHIEEIERNYKLVEEQREKQMQQELGKEKVERRLRLKRMLDRKKK